MRNSTVIRMPDSQILVINLRRAKVLAIFGFNSLKLADLSSPTSPSRSPNKHLNMRGPNKIAHGIINAASRTSGSTYQAVQRPFHLASEACLSVK
jgi:hypothetical protein